MLEVVRCALTMNMRRCSQKNHVTWNKTADSKLLPYKVNPNPARRKPFTTSSLSAPRAAPTLNSVAAKTCAAAQASREVHRSLQACSVLSTGGTDLFLAFANPLRNFTVSSDQTASDFAWQHDESSPLRIGELWVRHFFPPARRSVWPPGSWDHPFCTRKAGELTRYHARTKNVQGPNPTTLHLTSPYISHTTRPQRQGPATFRGTLADGLSWIGYSRIVAQPTICLQPRKPRDQRCSNPTSRCVAAKWAKAGSPTPNFQPLLLNRRGQIQVVNRHDSVRPSSRHSRVRRERVQSHGSSFRTRAVQEGPPKSRGQMTQTWHTQVHFRQTTNVVPIVPTRYRHRTNKLCEYISGEQYYAQFHTCSSTSSFVRILRRNCKKLVAFQEVQVHFC